jgi:predicted RND superfamily exporter protein
VIHTGIRPVIEVLAAALERDARMATAVAAAAIIGIAVVHFRRVGPAVLATIPSFVGFLWMLALMKALDLPVNVLNVIVFPMVIGIEDNAVHLVHRVHELGPASVPTGVVRRALDEIGLALFLCTATTLLGFGSLVLSENRGLASIGAVTIIGKVACFVASTVSLPAFLLVQERHSASKHKPNIAA